MQTKQHSEISNGKNKREKNDAPEMSAADVEQKTDEGFADAEMVPNEDDPAEGQELKSSQNFEKNPRH